MSDQRIIDEMNYDADNIYLKDLIGTIIKLMNKEMYVEVYKRCGGCMNEEHRQRSHDYCLLVDPATKATECFFQKLIYIWPMNYVLKNCKT